MWPFDLLWGWTTGLALAIDDGPFCIVFTVRPEMSIGLTVHPEMDIEMTAAPEMAIELTTEVCNE
jgi:hypothetical protein